VNDGTGLAEALLGLPGFRVLEVVETDDELIVTVETTATLVGSVRAVGCARSRRTGYRSTSAIWRASAGRPGCGGSSDAGAAGNRSAIARPGPNAPSISTPRSCSPAEPAPKRAVRSVSSPSPVTQVAEEFGVCWWTIMNAVIEHGTPLVDDPDRIGRVRQLGVDETSFLKAAPQHPTVYATGLVDLERHVLIDMVEGNSAKDLRAWAAGADPGMDRRDPSGATDLAESFRAGLSPHLDHVRRVADPFHVVRVGNRCLDQVRRRVQNETLGHRGRKHDPLYRIRKILLTGNERLDDRGRDRMLLGLRAGDPNDEVLGAWLAN
jgi:transposase